MNFLNSLNEIKSNFVRKENIFFFLLIIATFFLDRISKVKIISDFNDRAYYINNYINFELIWNIGIGFGFLSTDSNIFYNLITIIIGIVITILVYISVKSEKLDKLAYSIIIGGAFGNFYDRLVYNAVPDFIDLHYNNFHWFTFNVADIFITVGIFIFIFKEIIYKKL